MEQVLNETSNNITSQDLRNLIIQYTDDSKQIHNGYMEEIKTDLLLTLNCHNPECNHMMGLRYNYYPYCSRRCYKEWYDNNVGYSDDTTYCKFNDCKYCNHGIRTTLSNREGIRDYYKLPPMGRNKRFGHLSLPQ